MAAKKKAASAKKKGKKSAAGKKKTAGARRAGTKKAAKATGKRRSTGPAGDADAPHSDPVRDIAKAFARRQIAPGTNPRA